MPDPITTPNQPGATPGTPAPGAAPAGGTPDVAALQAQVAELTSKLTSTEGELTKVKDESIQRRQENKTLKEKLAPFEQAFKALVPEAKPGDAAAAAAQAAAEAQSKGILVHAHALTLAAKLGAHNADRVARMIDIEGIEVDLSKRSVDAAALTTRLEALKVSDPYLFAEAGAKPATAAGVPTPTPPKPGAGGTDGGSVTAQYDSLIATGKREEAHRLYLANRAVIGAHVESKLGRM